MAAVGHRAALGQEVVLVALALGILIAEARTRGRSKYYSSATGVARASALVQLGLSRWPALEFCAVVVFVSPRGAQAGCLVPLAGLVPLLLISDISDICQGR